jgi:hypothetical protein
VCALGGIRTPNLLIRSRRITVAPCCLVSPDVALWLVDIGVPGDERDGVRQGATSRPVVVGSDVGYAPPDGRRLSSLGPGEPRASHGRTRPARLTTSTGRREAPTISMPRRPRDESPVSLRLQQVLTAEGLAVAHALSGGRLAAFLRPLRDITPAVRVATPATSQESPIPAHLVASPHGPPRGAMGWRRPRRGSFSARLTYCKHAHGWGGNSDFWATPVGVGARPLPHAGTSGAEARIPRSRGVPN